MCKKKKCTQSGVGSRKRAAASNPSPAAGFLYQYITTPAETPCHYNTYTERTCTVCTWANMHTHCSTAVMFRLHLIWHVMIEQLLHCLGSKDADAATAFPNDSKRTICPGAPLSNMIIHIRIKHRWRLATIFQKSVLALQNLTCAVHIMWNSILLFMHLMQLHFFQYQTSQSA